MLRLRQRPADRSERAFCNLKTFPKNDNIYFKQRGRWHQRLAFYFVLFYIATSKTKNLFNNTFVAFFECNLG